MKKDFQIFLLILQIVLSLSCSEKTHNSQENFTHNLNLRVNEIAPPEKIFKEPRYLDCLNFVIYEKITRNHSKAHDLMALAVNLRLPDQINREDEDLLWKGIESLTNFDPSSKPFFVAAGWHYLGDDINIPDNASAVNIIVNNETTSAVVMRSYGALETMVFLSPSEDKTRTYSFNNLTKRIILVVLTSEGEK